MEILKVTKWKKEREVEDSKQKGGEKGKGE